MTACYDDAKAIEVPDATPSPRSRGETHQTKSMNVV